MAEFTKEGELNILGTVLHTGSSSEINLFLSKVVNLRFNNPAAYTLKLQIYNPTTLATTTLYDLSLSAGDTVTDNLSYALPIDSQLIATSNIVGTTYYIYGLDY